MQQQFCENGVQTSGNVGRTHVGQCRRTSCTVIVSYINHDGNKKAKASIEGSDIERLQGSPRNTILFDNYDHHLEQIAMARANLTGDQFKQIYKQFSSSEDKISTAEDIEVGIVFEQALSKPRTHHKEEEAVDIEVTPQMGGKILLKIMTKENAKKHNLDIHELLKQS